MSNALTPLLTLTPPNHDADWLNATNYRTVNYLPIYQTLNPTSLDINDFYVKRYFDHVLGIQYRLADQQTLPYLMASLSQASPAVRSSIALLSVLHTQAQAFVNGVRGITSTPASPNIGRRRSLTPVPPPPAAPIKAAQAMYDQLYAQTRRLLGEAQFQKGRFDEGDAMACLHVVSAFLFSGGRGVWDEFLGMAGDWVHMTILEAGGSPLAALLSMSPMGRFIFRTTMWMDIFSGVSVCRAPRFLGYYRRLFHPNMRAAFATGLSGSLGAGFGFGDGMEDTGMDRVMGCPNEVILAFAEVAHLESFRALAQESNADKASAEMLDLTVRTMGKDIEVLIPEANVGPAALPWDRFVEIKENSNMDEKFVDEDRRSKVAEVFRQAARVYLHSVIEGCDPQIPVIRQAVEASIYALTVSTYYLVRSRGPLTISHFFQALQSSPLDRALIFPLTITGCLALTQAEVDFCHGRLASVGSDAESFGNCLQARQLIDAVWAKRTLSGLTLEGVPRISRGVSWRVVMRELGEDPLLLV